MLALLALTALVLFPADKPASSLNAIRSLARARRFELAISRLEEYLRTHRDDSEAHLLMSSLATEPPDPRPDLALAHLRAVRPRDAGEAARVRFLQGKAEYQKGRYDLAEADWNSALALDPTVPEAGWALMDLLDREGRLRDAHRVGMRTQEVEPDPLDRARILLELARQDVDHVAPTSQVLLFGPLARAHPEDLELTLALADALVRDSQGAEAIERLESALKTHPDSPEVWSAWLSGLEGAHQLDRLVEEFGRLPKSMADDPRFARHEGTVAQNARDWKRAVRAFQRATAYEPSNGMLWYRLRAALRQAGDTAELERVNRWYTSFEDASRQMRPAYEEALRVPDLGVASHPELYHRLADLRARMGRPDEARAWHRLILRDNPADPISRAALKELE